MYGVLIKRKSINSAKWKWTNISAGFVNREIDYNHIFELSLKTLKESKFHQLQFKTLHRILITNEYPF